VDAHSQCKMRVRVKRNKVIEIHGDPTDPESKGELTVRGKQMREILYAPDRLKHVSLQPT
jgi:anaerobic selenocysteine-containing dehydrogenase